MNIISTIKHIIKGIDIDSLNKKIAELESNLNKIKNDNARKNAEITRLKKIIETINEDLTHKQDKISLAENKQKELALKLSEADKKITSLETQNDTLLETQKSLSKYNASFKADIISKDNKINTSVNFYR